MTLRVDLVTENLPESIRDLAEVWSKAVSAAIDLIQKKDTTGEDVSAIIELALHSAAAVIAPGELTPGEFIHTINRFSHALADVGAAYLEDKEAAEATKQ